MKSITLTKNQVIELQKAESSFFCGFEEHILNDDRVVSITFNSDFSCTYSLVDGSDNVGFGLNWYGLSFDELIYFSQNY